MIIPSQTDITCHTDHWLAQSFGAIKCSFKHPYEKTRPDQNWIWSRLLLVLVMKILRETETIHGPDFTSFVFMKKKLDEKNFLMYFHCSASVFVLFMSYLNQLLTSQLRKLCIDGGRLWLDRKYWVRLCGSLKKSLPLFLNAEYPLCKNSTPKLIVQQQVKHINYSSKTI